MTVFTTPDRRQVLTGLATALALPAIVGRAQAEQTLLIASLLGEDKPETRIWHRIRDLVEAEMPGAFAFNIVPNAALGGERDVVEGMRLGSIQASLSTLSTLSAWVPEAQLFDLPFLFRDSRHLEQALAGGCGEQLSARLTEQDLTAPAFIRYGARHLLDKEPLLDPQAMRGKRIRVIQSPLHAQLWEAFGALPIALPITETYNALSTGAVDAMDLTKAAYAGFRLYEVVPDVTETAHIHAAGAVLFSGRFWSGLDDTTRAVFSRAAREGASHFDALMAEEENAAVDTAKAAGARFHPVEDRSAWEATGRSVWESFADRVGGMERIEAVADLVDGTGEACR